MTQIQAGGLPQNQQGGPQYAQGEPSMQFSPALAMQMAQQAQGNQGAPQAQQPNTAPQTQGLQMGSAQYAQMGNVQVQNQQQPGGAPQYQQPGPAQYAQNLPQTQQIPGFQPVQQQPQIQQQVPQNQPGNLSQRIAAGPGVPPELVGRTMGEVIQMYGSVRAGAQQTGMQPPARPQVQQGAPQGQPQSNNPGANFWANPQEMIRQTVQETAMQIQAPQLIERAASTISGYPRDAELDQTIIGLVSNLDTTSLTDPRVWETAYNTAFGMRARQGRPVMSQTQQPQAQAQQQVAQPGFNQLNSGQQYVPAGGQFFTESPTGVNNAPVVQLNAQQQRIAKQFGMTEQMYAQIGGMVNGNRG